MGHLSVIPTPAAIEAAWETYSRMMRVVLDNPELSINRHYMEDVARAEVAWKEAFIASERGR